MWSSTAPHTTWLYERHFAVHPVLHRAQGPAMHLRKWTIEDLRDIARTSEEAATHDRHNHAHIHTHTHKGTHQRGKHTRRTPSSLTV